MSLDNPGEGGLTLRDIQAAHKEGTLQRTLIDTISQTNDVMEDVRFFPASNGDRDEADYVTSLPKAHFTMLGEGKVASGFSTQKKSVDSARAYVMMRILRDRYNELKKRGRHEQYLNDNVKMQLGSLGTLLVTAYMYGDRRDDPKGLNGAAKVYSKIGSISGSDLDPYTRVLDGALSGNSDKTDLRSIFILNFSQTGVKPFYPDYAKDCGLDFGDKMDEVHEKDAVNGGDVCYLQREFTWTNGIHFVDYRKAGRLANIPFNKILATTGTDYAKVLLEKLIWLSDTVKTDAGETSSWYMDPKLWTAVKTLLARLTWTNAFEEKMVDATRKERVLFGHKVRVNDCQAFAEAEVPTAS